MAVKTTLEQLEEVQAAITAVLTAQEMATGGSGGSKLVRADLAALQERERVLLARYRAEQATGGLVNRVSFGRPA